MIPIMVLGLLVPSSQGSDAASDNLLGFGMESGQILLWSLVMGEMVGTLSGGHVKAVTAVCFSAGGEQLYSASLDRSVMSWDVQAQTRLR